MADAFAIGSLQVPEVPTTVGITNFKHDANLLIWINDPPKLRIVDALGGAR
jgi:hypothetical protein